MAQTPSLITYWVEIEARKSYNEPKVYEFTTKELRDQFIEALKVKHNELYPDYKGAGLEPVLGRGERFYYFKDSFDTALVESVFDED